MASEITYVGVGAAGTTDGGSNPTATLPSGVTDDDLMLCAFWSREAVDGTVSISAGWTQIYNNRTANGLMALWYRFFVAADVAPTITLANHAGGASGDDVIVQVAAWRGIDTANPFGELGSISELNNNQDLGTSDAAFDIDGVLVPRSGLVVILAGKRDDWTSVDDFTENNAPATGLTYIEIAEPDATAGADAGMVWDYAINPLGNPEVDILGGWFNVIGGAAALGRGVMLSFNLDADAFAVADHLVAYCAQAHPETDGGIPGGAIDATMRAIFTDIAADDDIEVLSDNVLDSGNAVYIKGRDSSGDVVWEIAALNGTTAVIFSTMGVIERIEEFRILDTTVGNITVRRSVAGATIAVVPAGETGFKRIFRGAYANDNAAKDYYEKIFLRNIHPVVTVTNLEIDEDADPAADLTFTLAASINDEAYSTDRLTAPDVADTEPDTFDATAKDAPADLDSGDAIGVWLKLTVAAGQTNTKNTYTLGVTGDTI